MRISDWSSDVCSSDLVHILGPDGEELAPGEQGEVWFETPSRFEYHGDPAKTAAAWNDKGWSSLGDVGNLDADGYLYLADRVSNMRSEEHTSELQSLMRISYAVFCLKKKKKHNKKHH